MLMKAALQVLAQSMALLLQIHFCVPMCILCVRGPEGNMGPEKEMLQPTQIKQCGRGN